MKNLQWIVCALVLGILIFSFFMPCEVGLRALCAWKHMEKQINNF